MNERQRFELIFAKQTARVEKTDNRKFWKRLISSLRPVFKIKIKTSPMKVKATVNIEGGVDF